MSDQTHPDYSEWIAISRRAKTIGDLPFEMLCSIIASVGDAGHATDQAFMETYGDNFTGDDAEVNRRFQALIQHMDVGQSFDDWITENSTLDIQLNPIEAAKEGHSVLDTQLKPPQDAEKVRDMRAPVPANVNWLAWETENGGVALARRPHLRPELVYGDPVLAGCAMLLNPRARIDPLDANSLPFRRAMDLAAKVWLVNSLGLSGPGPFAL